MLTMRADRNVCEADENDEQEEARPTPCTAGSVMESSRQEDSGSIPRRNTVFEFLATLEKKGKAADPMLRTSACLGQRPAESQELP
jgi:hypothetical protein